MPPPSCADGPSSIVVDDVDQVGGAGHRFGFRLDLRDVGKALETLLGTIERGIGEPAAFQLTHFTSQHFIVDLGHVVENDVAHVHAIARIDEERERELLVIGIAHRRGHRVNLGECESIFTETVLQQLLGGRDDLARERVARLHEQIAPQQRLGHREGSGELHFLDLEHLAFVDVHGDENVVLLGGDGDLGGFHLEVRVAAIHIEGAQLFQVTLQRLARIAIVLLVEGKQVGRLELEGFEDVLFLERVIADNIDLADLGALAFDDIDLDLDAIARDFLDGRVDASRVLAARAILVLEERFDVLEHGAIEGLALRETHVAQGLVQIFVLDVLVALELEALDGRAFVDHHDQHVAIAAQLDVTKEAGVV